MSFKPEEIEDALEKILINLDAAFTAVSLNSLAFQMMVKTLTDKVCLKLKNPKIKAIVVVL